MSVVRSLTAKIIDSLKKADNLILLAIIGFDVYIRLWDIGHLFKWIEDYDEGAYSLGGNFIAQGFLPYKDFILVHPPLYDLSLAAIYNIFGYNFYYGRIFSAILSVVCVILAYLIMKRLFNSISGIFAAALLVFFPGLMSTWYRVVQEPLGIFFVLLGIYFCLDYIKIHKVDYKIIMSGICLGLAIATKYTFVSAVAGIVFALFVLSIQNRWKQPSSWFNRETGFIVLGTIVGFLAVTGYFLITVPHEYLAQTFSSQIDYRVGGMPIKNVLRVLTLPQVTWGKTIQTLCIYSVFVTLVVILMRRKYSRSNLFLGICLITSLAISATFNRFGEVRFFATPFVFTLLNISSLVPSLDRIAFASRMTFRRLKREGIFIIILIYLVCCVAGILVLLRYDYNYIGPEGVTYEERVYKQAVDYLESVNARQVYSLNPIVPALSSKIKSSLDFDIFGMLEVLNQSPSEIVNKQMDNGADYYVEDADLRLLSTSMPGFAYLIIESRQTGTLVESFRAGQLPLFDIDIYAISQKSSDGH